MNYLDLLRDWERNSANPAIYEHLNLLFPAYGFRRVQVGCESDRWVSPLKLDLSKPLSPSREKTVVGKIDFCFREQGQWDQPIGVIEMLSSFYGLGSIYEAYSYAAMRLGLKLPTTSGLGSYGYKERDRCRRLLETLEEYFVWYLRNNNGKNVRIVREYLLSRGFTKEWIDFFRFGFVPSWDKVEAYITSPRLGFSADELDKACHIPNVDGYSTVGRSHVLAIPYRCGGELKGFLFRAVEDGIYPKYKANAGLDRKSSFFNIRGSGTVGNLLVMEGEIDALTATAVGIEDAVAIGGSEISGERRNQIYDAFGRGVRRIYLCPDLDTDANGNAATGKRFRAVRRSLHTIFDVSPDFNEVYVVRFPHPSDPDEFIRRYGANAFRRLLSDALPWWKYLNEEMECSVVARGGKADS